MHQGVPGDKADPQPQRPIQRPILVRDLSDGLAAVAAAAELGIAVDLLTLPGAGSFGGAGWAAALHGRLQAAAPGITVRLWVDVAEDLGHGLAALRSGLGHLVFTGGSPAADTLAALAGAHGATVLWSRPDAVLIRRRDRRAAYRHYLMGGGVESPTSTSFPGRGVVAKDPSNV